MASNYGQGIDIEKSINSESGYNALQFNNNADEKERLRLWSEQAKNAYDSVVLRLKQKEGILKIKSQEVDDLVATFKENQLLLEHQRLVISQLEERVAAQTIELNQLRQWSCERENDFQYSITNLQALASTYLDEVRAVRENAAVTTSESICSKCKSNQRNDSSLLLENSGRLTSIVMCPNNLSNDSNLTCNDSLTREYSRLDSLGGGHCTGVTRVLTPSESDEDLPPVAGSAPLSLRNMGRPGSYDLIQPYNAQGPFYYQHPPQSFNSFSNQHPAAPTTVLLPLHHHSILSHQLASDCPGTITLQQQLELESSFHCSNNVPHGVGAMSSNGGGTVSNGVLNTARIYMGK